MATTLAPPTYSPQTPGRFETSTGQVECARCSMLLLYSAKTKVKMWQPANAASLGPRAFLRVPIALVTHDVMLGTSELVQNPIQCCSPRL